MMQTDVMGKDCAAGATTTVYDGRARFKGIWYSSSGASTIAVKDGATTLFTFTVAGQASDDIWIPGEGVLCETSLVITTGAGLTAVVFYG
jgi:hypothetical protein